MIDKIKAYAPINTQLAGNWVNWVIVFLMVAIAGLAASLFFQAPSGDKPQ